MSPNVYIFLWESAKNRYICSHWAKNRYILKRNIKRTPRAVFLAHEKAWKHFTFFLRLNRNRTICGLQNFNWKQVFSFLCGSYTPGIYVSASTVFIITLTIHYWKAIYDVCAVATSLAYEQDWNRDYFEIDLPLSILFQQAAAAYACRMGRDLVRVAVYQFITMRRRMRMIRVGALMYGLWLAQNSPKTVET